MDQFDSFYLFNVKEGIFNRIGGSVVECSPATRAARVRFPADAIVLQENTAICTTQLYALNTSDICVLLILCSSILGHVHGTEFETLFISMCIHQHGLTLSLLNQKQSIIYNKKLKTLLKRGIKVKSMQRSGTEAIRNQIHPSKPKREINK